MSALLITLGVTSAASADEVPPTVIEVPVLTADAVTDPCGPGNAVWNDLVDQNGTLSYTTQDDGHLVAAIITANTVFTDNTTTHDYGLAPDSNVACPTPPPVRSPLPPLPHTRAQGYHRCLYHTDIVQHKGTNTRRGPDVDSASWIARALTRSNRVELDLQVANTSPEVFSGFLYHDATLGPGTRNGSGRLYRRSPAYLSTRITNHGQHLGKYRWFLAYLAAHPRKKAQLEHKNYYGQFTPDHVRQAYALQVAYGVQHRIKDSSHWVGVLRTLESIDPSIYTEQIGFYDVQPNLKAIIKYGLDQANMTYRAAFRHYGHYRTFLAAARAHGVHTLVRSESSGAGDSGYWWSREIKAGAQTLVVQGKTHRQVCDAVRRNW